LYFIVSSDNQSTVELEQKANVELIDKSNSTQISPVETPVEIPSENKIEKVQQTKTQSGIFKEISQDKIVEAQASFENPVTEKIELPFKQEIITPKTEMLVSKDTKTETVEGNPETESFDNNSSDEVKIPEPESKKDYPVVNNAISPDGDGLNDELVIEMPAVDFYHLRIFTKKGVLVFETENVNVKWKGMILGSGQLAENGDYRYIIEYQLKGKENVKAIGGFIFLNR
jgi:methionine-rich copper-binding protein CopC